MKTKTTNTTKIVFTWKRGLCAALACLLLGLTACSAATPVETNADPGAASGATAPATTQVPASVDTAEDIQTTAAPVGTDTAENLQTTEAPTPETTAPNASKVEYNSRCGENLTWNISKYGTLVIEGGGAMYDYDDKENRAPWYESRDKFDSVSLPEGLSSIGSYAFCDLTNLDDPDYLNGRFYWINIPNSVVSVGSHAFQNANIVNLVLPESLSSVADSALSGCTALRELWVMNPDCAFGAEQEVSPELEVCGFPDSTAERFAREKGCSFNPMTPDQDAVVEQLRAEEEGRQGTRIVWAAKCAAGYMAKVVTFEPVSVTEEALQQAKQTGSMVVDGVECAYTESREQAEEWGFVSENSEEAEGWIVWIHEADGSGKRVYSVLREGDHFIFSANLYHHESDHVLRQEEPRDLAWFLMDDNTLVDYGDVRLGEFLAEDNSYARNFPGDMFYYPNLHLTSDGEIFVEVIKSGAKR